LSVNGPSGNEPEKWKGKIVFQDRITDEERALLERALVGTTFLKQSVMLAYDNRGVEIDQIPANGIWISRVFSFLHHLLYRLSINTTYGRHFDLLLAIRKDIDEELVLETTYLMVALCGHAQSPPVVRQFGCYRPELGALSMALVSDLTVWERVREFAGGSFVEFLPSRKHWRNLFIRGMSAFFIGWLHSDRRILPGPVTPANAVVPATDYRADVKILSVADWEPYDGPMSLIRPMVKNFYLQTISNYPSCRKDLEISWMFDACVESLGMEEAKHFLGSVLRDLDGEEVSGLDVDLSAELSNYLQSLEEEYHVPLPLECAIERYQEWGQSNPNATTSAKERQISELYRLYQLERFEDIARYGLYRHTYFAEADPEILAAFDRLLHRMFTHPKQRPTHMVELSNLQAVIKETTDRLVFSRLVFPAARPVEIRGARAYRTCGDRAIVSTVPRFGDVHEFVRARALLRRHRPRGTSCRRFVLQTARVDGRPPRRYCDHEVSQGPRPWRRPSGGFLPAHGLSGGRHRQHTLHIPRFLPRSWF
jgi:hypothetical protein